MLLRPSRGNSWKIGKYENESLTNTFIDIMTQFWLNQNSPNLVEKVTSLEMSLTLESIQNANHLTVKFYFYIVAARTTVSYCFLFF